MKKLILILAIVSLYSCKKIIPDGGTADAVYSVYLGKLPLQTTDPADHYVGSLRWINGTGHRKGTALLSFKVNAKTVVVFNFNFVATTASDVYTYIKYSIIKVDPSDKITDIKFDLHYE